MLRKTCCLSRSIAALLIFTAAIHAAIADPEVAQLDFFVGRWDCDGHIIANGTQIKSVITFSWDEDTKTLSVHHDDLAPNKYHAFELWGVSKAAKEFRSSIGDAYSGIRWYISPGFVGETLAWTRSEGGIPAERFSYSRKGPMQFTLEWWIARNGGSLVVGDMIDCRRAQ